MESSGKDLEVFYLNSTLNFGIPPVLVFQLEVCYEVDWLLTGIPAQQKGITARWYSNKIFKSLMKCKNTNIFSGIYGIWVVF